MSIRNLRVRIVSIITCISLAMNPRVVFADSVTDVEYKVKAVILFNLAKYVKWPDTAFASPDAHLKICVLGASPFGKLFDDVNGKPVQERTLEIVNIAEPKTGVDLKGCQIAFWNAKSDSKVGPVIDMVKTDPILTVSELPDKGIVSFFIEDSKVRFAISLKKAKSAALTISSQLLKLAKITDEE